MDLGFVSGSRALNGQKEAPQVEMADEAVKVKGSLKTSNGLSEVTFPYDLQTMDQRASQAANTFYASKSKDLKDEPNGIDEASSSLLAQLRHEQAQPEAIWLHLNTLKMSPKSFIFKELISGTIDELPAVTWLAKEGLMKALQHLVAQQGKAILDQVDSTGETVLVHAARSGHQRLVAWLVDQRPGLLQASPSGFNAVHAAASGNQLDTLLWLHDRDNTLIAQTNSRGQGTMFWAAAGGALDVVKYLEAHHSSMNTQTVLKNANGKEVTIVIQHAVHIAAQYGRNNIVEYFSHISDIPNREGRTPLHLAVMHGQIDVARLLLNLGHDPLQLIAQTCLRQEQGTLDCSFGPDALHGESCLHLAAEREDTGILAELLDRSRHRPDFKQAIDQRDRDGKSPLHRAVWQVQKPAIVQLLLEAGANPRLESEWRYTSLHWAAKHGHLASAQLLLKAGALTDAANESGDTPIELAIRWGQDETARFLIDPEHYVDLASTPPPAEDPAGYLYNCFEQAYKEGNATNQIFYLEKLSHWYLNRKEYLKTSHLLNAALHLAEIYNFNFSYMSYVSEKLKKVGELFIFDVLKIKTIPRTSNYITHYRQCLQNIRKQAQEQLDANVSVFRIQRTLTDQFAGVLRDMIARATGILGAPHTGFAVIGLGSMSRREMCPYSDLEFAFLIEDSSKENKRYFYNLQRILDFFFVNLGETEWLLLRPSKNRDEATSINPAGFSLDRGGLSPIGKEGLYDLIGTPREFARFQSDAWSADEVILSNAMATTSHVMGNSDLSDRYRGEISNALRKSGKRRGLSLLKGHIEEFKPWLSDERVDLLAFDAKKDFYRPIQMIIEGLALYYSLSSLTTLGRILELKDKKLLSSEGAQHLKKALSTALSLRLRTQFFYQERKEIMAHKAAKGNSAHFAITPQELELIADSYRVLIPLHRQTTAFVKGDSKALINSSFYDTDVRRAGTLSKGRVPYDEAEQKYLASVAVDPHDPQTLSDLGRIKYQLDEASKALTHLLQALAIIKRKHGPRPHKDTASILNDLGMVCIELCKWQDAIDYLQESLTIEKVLSGGVSNADIAATLINLGIVYRNTAEPELAISHYQEALSILDLAYLDTPHSLKATALHNLAIIYEKKGELASALAYAQRSLEMREKIYAGRDHHDMFYSLSQVGRINNFLGRLKTAAVYHEAALAIIQRLYGKKSSEKIVLVQLGLVVLYLSIGKAKKALVISKEALIASQAGYEGSSTIITATCLNNIGKAYRKLGSMDLAVDHYKQAIAASKPPSGGTYKPDIKIARFLNNLGEAYVALGKLDEGMHLLNQSIDMLKQLPESRTNPQIGLPMSNLGEAFRIARQPQKAIEHLLSALATYLDRPHPDLVITLDYLSLAYRDTGQHEEAAAYRQRALHMQAQLLR